MCFLRVVMYDCKDILFYFNIGKKFGKEVGGVEELRSQVVKELRRSYREL